MKMKILSHNIYQGLFCHDQVSSGFFFAFFNLGRSLRMFLETMEPKAENKNSSLDKNVLIIWAQRYGSKMPKLSMK